MTHTHNSIVDKQVEAFPPLPVTATKVLSVTSDPESSIEDLMEAILPDQMMCGVILKVANSAFFGMPREVSSIERAVVILGYEEIRNIVMCKAVLGSLPPLPVKTRQKLNPFWEHAFNCALTARTIAGHVRKSPGELFIAGLLHDIGKIAMILAFPNDYDLLRDISRQNSNCLTTDEEKDRFRVSHAEAGLRLARKWLLPEQLMMAIGFHHSPQDAPGYNQSPLIIQVADFISLMYCCLEKTGSQDFEKMFNDFWPSQTETWENYDLSWKPEILHSCFEILQKQNEDQQGVLSLFSS